MAKTPNNPSRDSGEAPPSVTLNRCNHVIATQLSPWLQGLSMRVIDMAIDHRVTMTMPITEAIIRPPGIVAGQAQMAFIDTAALMVCWSVMGEFGDCTTVSQDNHFLRAAQGGQLVARARPRKAGRQLVFIDVELFVDSGMEPVTSAAVIYMRL